MFSQLTDKLEGAFKEAAAASARSPKPTSAKPCATSGWHCWKPTWTFKVTKDLIEAVTAKALGEEVLLKVSPGQQIVKFFHDELVAILGGGASDLDLGHPQADSHGRTERCG